MKTSFKYLEPYAQRDEQRFYMAGVGLHESMDPQIVNRPKGTWDWLLMFFHSPVEIAVETKVTAFPANTLMIWDDTQGHFYGNTDSSWSHSWIHCQGSVVMTLMTQAGQMNAADPPTRARQTER